jgi:glycosyltransferase involved in cell wall biosynthesis
MRLCFVVHQFFPYAQSGTEQYCLAVAREARRRGDDVTILSLHWAHDREHPPISVEDEPYDGFRVLRLSHWKGINPNDILRDYDNRHLECWFRQVLDDVQPDAVHFFHLRQLGANLIQIAKTSEARVVVNLMDFWYLCPRFTLRKSDGSLCEGPPNGGIGCISCNHPGLQGVEPAESPAQLKRDQASRLRALLDRKDYLLQQLALADSVIAPSKFLASMFEKNGFNHKAMEVVPYGLESERVEARPVERPRKPFRLAFCGVLSPWKAPGLVVNAVRRIDADLELRIWGNTEETMFADYIRTVQQAAHGDSRITFSGPYSGDQTSDVFAEMDALVVPSTWYENTPFVVLEAFAAGVPCIASNLGGLSEIVQDGQNGLLFPAGNAKALAAAIERIITEPGLYERLKPGTPPDIKANFSRFAAIYAGQS